MQLPRKAPYSVCCATLAVSWCICWLCCQPRAGMAVLWCQHSFAGGHLTAGGLHGALYSLQLLSGACTSRWSWFLGRVLVRSAGFVWFNIHFALRLLRVGQQLRGRIRRSSKASPTSACLGLPSTFCTSDSEQRCVAACGVRWVGAQLTVAGTGVAGWDPLS